MGNGLILEPAPHVPDKGAGDGPDELLPREGKARRSAWRTKLYLSLAGGASFVLLWFLFKDFTNMKIATAVFGALGAATFTAVIGLEVASFAATLRARMARRRGSLLDAARFEEFAYAASPRAGRKARVRKAQEAASMQTHLVFEDHSGPVTALSFAPQGTHLATGGEDGRVMIRCTASGGEVHSVGFDSPVTAMAFRPDGEKLAIGTKDGRVHLLELGDGKPELALEQSFPIVALGFAPDDSLVTASTSSGEVYLPRGEAKPMVRLEAGGEEVTSATFDARCERLVAGTTSGSITVWDVRGEPVSLARLMQGGPVRVASLSRDGKLLVTCGGPRPFLWDVAGFRRIGGLDANEDVFGIAFSPDAKTVLACTLSSVLCFSTSRMAGLRVFSMDARRILVAGMSADERTIAAGASDGKVGIWRQAGA